MASDTSFLSDSPEITLHLYVTLVGCSLGDPVQNHLPPDHLTFNVLPAPETLNPSLAVPQAFPFMSVAPLLF